MRERERDEVVGEVFHSLVHCPCFLTALETLHLEFLRLSGHDWIIFVILSLSKRLVSAHWIARDLLLLLFRVQSQGWENQTEPITCTFLFWRETWKSHFSGQVGLPECSQTSPAPLVSSHGWCRPLQHRQHLGRVGNALSWALVRSTVWETVGKTHTWVFYLFIFFWGSWCLGSSWRKKVEESRPEFGSC